MGISNLPLEKNFNSQSWQNWLNSLREHSLYGDIPNPTKTIGTEGIKLENNNRNYLLRAKGQTALTQLTATQQISEGSDGQVLTIEGMDNNKIELHEGDGVQLTGGNNVEIGTGDIIQLMYNKERAVWVELFRSIK